MSLWSVLYKKKHEHLEDIYLRRDYQRQKITSHVNSKVTSAAVLPKLDSCKFFEGL